MSVFEKKTFILGNDRITKIIILIIFGKILQVERNMNLSHKIFWAFLGVHFKGRLFCS